MAQTERPVEESAGAIGSLLNNKLLVSLTVAAFLVTSASALADDKTTVEPIDQQKLKEERMKAKTAERQRQLGSTVQPGGNGQPKALPLKGGFGPAGGRAEKAMRDADKDANKKRTQQEREESEKAWAKKYGPDDPSKKGPAQ